MRIIINGKTSGSPQLRTAVARLRGRGQRLDVRVTWEAGDAARFAEEALRDEVDVLIAAGGDGTLNEVVDGLFQVTHEPSVAVGVVPFGTANDFAGGCGIPTDTLAALDLIATTESVPIDVGWCNERYFVNVASGGFGAEVTARTPPEMKKAIGGAAYSLMGLAMALKMAPYNARLSTPDGRVEQGQLFIVAVGNGRQAGGGIVVSPSARLDDGLLDVMGIVDTDLTQFGALFGELANMSDPENTYVKYAQLPAFTIEADEVMQMNLDGEPLRGKVFEFGVIPRALRFILPHGAPLSGF